MPSDKELEAWVKDIYKKSDKAGLHIPTVQAYAEKFWNAVQEGYGKGFADVQIGDTDYNTLAHLRKNVYHFSAAKNHAELKAITSKVVTDGGKVRTWAQFRKEAAKITSVFRGSWMEAEYELAVAGGQMAGKWQEFKRTGDDTMLRYSTVKDARVSDICKPLEGVTKPINDAFWNTYYPPNHFRCRCDVDRIPYNTKGTPADKTPAPEIPKMLRTNLAKQGLVFPSDHPYFKGIPKYELSTYLLRMDEAAQYEHLYTSPSGGKVKIHILQLVRDDLDSDLNDVINAAKKMADNGHKVEIIPRLDRKGYNTARDTLLKGVIKKKNPDYRINGMYGDLKQPIFQADYKKDSFTKLLQHAGEQSQFPVIEFSFDVDKKIIEKACRGKIAGKGKIRKIQIYFNDGTQELFE